MTARPAIKLKRGRGVTLAALCLMLGVSAAATTYAQSVAAAPPVTTVRPVAAVIEEYVRLGLSSNLALQSASLEVERAEAALDAARGRFFPRPR